MRHIVRGLIIFLIPIILSVVLEYVRHSKQSEDGKVYLHKFLAILGAITSVVFLIPAIITAFLDEPLWIPIIFLLLSLLGITLIIAFINCRISYDQDGFVHKSFFGIKRRFTYDQVTAIKENTHEKFLYVGNRRLMVDEFSIGGDDFIKLVKKKYRTIHDGKSIPKIYKTKYDIFNGNVTDAGGFLFAYIIVAVLLIGLVILMVVYTYFSPSTKSNTIERSVRFISCDAKQEEVVLTSADKQIYVIRFIDDQFNSKDIQAICDEKTVVTAYSTEVTPRYADDYYSLKAIVHNGRYLLSFEETNRFHSQEYRPLIAFALGMFLLFGVYVAGSIVVGRNPKKFSKRVTRLFFKDGYIKH